MLKGLFARRETRPDPGRESAAHLKDCVRTALALTPEDAVTVSEIVCLDPACPGSETVILVMRQGRRTEAAKVAKPLGEVTEQDLAAALVALHAGGPP